MKHSYLAMLLSAAALGATAGGPVNTGSRISLAQDIVVNKIKTTNADNSVKLGRGAARINTGGLKRLEYRMGTKNLGSAIQRKAPVAKAAQEGAVFYESFEGWDGQDLKWIPDEWVRQTGIGKLQYTWTPNYAEPSIGMFPSDGDCLFMINYCEEEEQDEWLITPMIDLAENMVLKFNAYIDPATIFSFDNVDWDEYAFIGEPVVAATLQIMAKAEGQTEWTLVHDFADDYRHLSLMEMSMLTPYGLEGKTVSLAALGGQKAQLALRYVGKGGNLMAIDEIMVTVPSLEGLSYMDPLCTQFWGFERSSDMACFSLPIAQMPVYAPLEWTNMTQVDGATYTWAFFDPASGEWRQSDDQYGLTATFTPNYATPGTKRNNFAYPVELKGSAPGTTEGSYVAPYSFIQAGGKFEIDLADGTSMEGGLLPFNFFEQELTITTVDVPKYGDATLPIFGYDANSDNYWLDYVLNGEEPAEGDSVKLDGILNFIYPSAAPMVVNGADVFAKGEVADDAEFTLRIFALGNDFYFDPNEQKPLATATCKGSDFLRNGTTDGYNTTLCIPFDFESPVALAASDEVAAYVVYLTGFNSPKVEYFAPYQSYKPDPNYMCLGWYTMNMKVMSDTWRMSVAPMASFAGEAGDCYNAFAINLHAEMPWLTAETGEVALPADGTPVEVALGSYYNGSDLAVEAPAGVEASVAGRYDECVLTLKKDDAAVQVDGTVKVSAPGLAVEIPVKTTTGIAGIETSNAAVVEIYDLAGRKVEPARAKAGVYLLKRADGTVTKTVVK